MQGNMNGISSRLLPWCWLIYCTSAHWLQAAQLHVVGWHFSDSVIIQRTHFHWVIWKIQLCLAVNKWSLWAGAQCGSQLRPRHTDRQKMCQRLFGFIQIHCIRNKNCALSWEENKRNLLKGVKRTRWWFWMNGVITVRRGFDILGSCCLEQQLYLHF